MSRRPAVLRHPATIHPASYPASYPASHPASYPASYPAPSHPPARVDYAALPTYSVHTIYLAAENVTAEGAATMTRMTEFVLDNIKILMAMGVQVRVEKVRPRDPSVASRSMLAYLSQMGVDKLPALISEQGVYIGAKMICDLYEANIKEYLAFQQREDAATLDAFDRDDGPLAAMYRFEMDPSRIAQESKEDESLGNEGNRDDMMARATQAMAARTSRVRQDDFDGPEPELHRGHPARAGRPEAPKQYADVVERLADARVDKGTVYRSDPADTDYTIDDDDDPKDRAMEAMYWSRNAPTD